MGQKYQLLAAALNGDDLNLIREMHITSDAVIINQCGEDYSEEMTLDGHRIKLIHTTERGVGKSRNLAVKTSDADIIEFADDDMVFTENYAGIVLDEFTACPEADLIVFSIESLNPDRPLLKIHSFGRIGYRKAMKYGCARIAARRDRLIRSGVLFSEFFGGGARYGSGEDTLFLTDCMKAGLRIYESPRKVADVKQETSTWFKGFNDKYYRDKGALFAAVFPLKCYLYSLLTALKRKDLKFSRSHVLKLYLEGIREYKKEVQNQDKRKADQQL